MYAKIPRNESVGPRRVASRAPSFVPKLQSRRSVARQTIRMEIGREIARTIALVSVDVLFESRRAPAYPLRPMVGDYAGVSGGRHGQLRREE